MKSLKKLNKFPTSYIKFINDFNNVVNFVTN